MGDLKSSKKQSLLDGETKNAQAKGKQKIKEKKNTNIKPKEKYNPSEGGPGSRNDKQKKFDKAKWSYYKRGNHLENLCMKKTLEQMYRILE